MALNKNNHEFVNNLLYVDGVKFHRSKGDGAQLPFSGGGGQYFHNFRDIDFWFFAKFIISAQLTYSGLTKLTLPP